MSSKKPNEFKKGFIISHYRLERLIGQGGYGYIFIASNVETEQEYAMKIEKIIPNKRGLKPEIQFMPQIQGSPYFPALIESGEDTTYRWIVYELLGPSLTYLRWQMHGDHFTKFTAFRCAIEMLRGIEECHNRGFIHRDIKPGNFLIRPSKKHPVVLIDFGLSRQFIVNGDIIPPRKHVGFIGTTRYASINVYKGKEQCRGDDLISWFYSVIEIVRGNLPFPITKNKQKLLDYKSTLTTAKLCKGLPPEFVEIWDSIKDLTYYDAPDYNFIYHKLEECNNNLSRKDPEYDWLKFSTKTVKKISAIDFRDDADETRITVFDEEGNISQHPPICTIA